MTTTVSFVCIICVIIHAYMYHLPDTAVAVSVTVVVLLLVLGVIIVVVLGLAYVIRKRYYNR